MKCLHCQTVGQLRYRSCCFFPSNRDGTKYEVSVICVNCGGGSIYDVENAGRVEDIANRLGRLA